MTVTGPLSAQRPYDEVREQSGVITETPAILAPGEAGVFSMAVGVAVQAEFRIMAGAKQDVVDVGFAVPRCVSPRGGVDQAASGRSGEPSPRRSRHSWSAR